MKKWLIGSMITALIGVVPTGTYAANGLNDLMTNSSVRVIEQSYYGDNDSRKHRQDRDNKDEEQRERERRDKERKEREQREQDRRHQEKSDQDRREQERRDQDQKERERKEQEQRERERREQEQKEREQREQEQKEREWREWEHRNHRDPNHWEHNREERVRRIREYNDAQYIIHRTAPVVILAQRSAAARFSFIGLALVIAHQQKAHELYEAGLYREAIFHSLRARRLALIIIARNKSNWYGPVMDDREQNYYSCTPNDNELDLRIDRNRMSPDHEAVKIILNIDIN